MCHQYFSNLDVVCFTKYVLFSLNIFKKYNKN
jgi:hypothetical protein